MSSVLQRIPHFGELLLRIETGWRDFVRGHTVGQQRRLGFVGPFPFLLMMRWAMFFAVLIRVKLETQNRGSTAVFLVATGVLAFLNIPLTYSYQRRTYHLAQLAQWVFILCDLGLITYLVLWAREPQSDVFLLYMLPLFTATEYLGGWPTVTTFSIVTVAYGMAVVHPQPSNAGRIAIFLTREFYLLFFVLLTLCLFQVTSVSLGDFHAALRRINEENRTAVDLDKRLDELLQEIKGLGFEFVGISMVDRYQKLIVMTKAVNVPAGWIRQSRRPLDGQDIMADIVRNPRAQTPGPDDPRFERKTWRVFKHALLARAYVPVMYGGDVVGILQAGWERARKGDEIGQKLVDELSGLAGEYAHSIALARPHAFLERLCRIVMDAVSPCAAVTLHICQDGQQALAARAGTYSHEYVMRLASAGGPVDPLIGGSAPKWLDVATLVKLHYPELYGAGCRSLAAMPLSIGPETKGALLVHFTDEQRFGNWLKAQIRLLAQGVEFRIQNRLLLTRFALLSSSAWMQSRLKTVEDALVSNAPLQEVLQRVADHFLYNLEADLVTLYEYRPHRHDFRVPPLTAGEILEEGAMQGTIQTGNLLWDCLAGSSSFYSELPPEFRSTRQDGSAEERFAGREHIQSCAVLVLQMADSREKAGLIFVNYRRRFAFSPEDRVAMLTLASSAAVAIRTARSIDRRRDTVQAMQEIEKVIATGGEPPDLDLILQHVLESACRLTGASEGGALWFTSNREFLEWRKCFGCAQPEQRLLKPEDPGPAGEAATGKRFRLVAEAAENRFTLAVPLLDRQDVMGVVVLHSGQHHVLTEEDATTVEMLGILAVVGARFAELYTPLVALGAVAARLQEKPFDLDTALRIILTGVTAGEGLGFSRAMVFLQQAGTPEAMGRLAVGPLCGPEAHDAWEAIENQKREFRTPGDPFFNRLLDEAERISLEIRGGARRDSALSEHVQSVSLPGSLSQTPLGDYATSPCGALFARGEWEGNFACVPLMVKDNCRGFLIADRDFQGRRVNESDARLLQLFADIAANAVESLTVRTPASESERLEQWMHLFSESRHEVGTRLSILDGFVDDFHRGLDRGSPHRPDLDTFLWAVRRRIANANWMAKKIQPWTDQAVALDEEIDLVEMVEGAVADTRLVFHRATIKLEQDDVPYSAQLRLKCDPLEMEGAFAELLRNAAEALDRIRPPGDLVKVRIGVEDADGDAAWAKIEVSDNGPGIPLAMRDRVFDPQFTTKESGYHGYGLVGAKRRVESAGGTIQVVGPESAGASIHIRLPIRLERVPMRTEV